MRLDPLSSRITTEISKVEKAERNEKLRKSKKSSSSDSHIFSADAKRLSDVSSSIEVVATRLASEPDIRYDKVNEVKKKIDNGFYNSPEFGDKLAEKLISDLGLK